MFFNVARTMLKNMGRPGNEASHDYFIGLLWSMNIIILYACLHTTVGKLFRIDDFPGGQFETFHAVTVCIN